MAPADVHKRGVSAASVGSALHNENGEVREIYLDRHLV